MRTSRKLSGTTYFIGSGLDDIRRQPSLGLTKRMPSAVLTLWSTNNITIEKYPANLRQLTRLREKRIDELIVGYGIYSCLKCLNSQHSNLDKSGCQFGPWRTGVGVEWCPQSLASRALGTSDRLNCWWWDTNDGITLTDCSIFHWPVVCLKKKSSGLQCRN